MSSGTQQFVDHADRALIEGELDKNIVVLAGAGAGKTYALIQRMVGVVRTGRARPGQMVAITFTRKAAGEMRSRFNLGLQEAAEAAAGEEAERLRRALEESDRCFIGTIHAFCGRLLRERPLDAGLSPDFQEIDDREEQELRRAAWDRYVLKAFHSEDPIFGVLDELGLEVGDLYAFYEARCTFGDLPLKPTPADEPDLSVAIEAAQGLLAEAEALAAEVRNNPDPFFSMVQQARRLEHQTGLGRLAEQARFLQLVAGKDKKDDVKVTRWGKRGSDVYEQAVALRDERRAAVLDRHVKPALEAWRNYAYARVAPWIDGAVQAFDEEREEAGRLSFADLLGRAATLLRESPGARAFFQERYTHLFVDEFQDTDPVQAEVLFYLTGDDPGQKDWRRLTPRPGRLFIVGDGKQSIYRFRRADVELFQEVCDLVGEAGGEVLRLTTNFRSLGRLCDWINRSFEPLFADDRQLNERAQAPFARLDNFRGEGSDAHGVRRITIPWETRDTPGTIRGREAETIAACIEQCLGGCSPLNGSDREAPVGEKASPGDFMILTRRTASLADYARALEAHGIPYDVVGGEQLVDVVTVKALLTLLEVAYAPENPVHYLAYLRGPFVGLSDGELLAFREARGTFSYEAPVPEGLGKELKSRLEKARGDVRRAVECLAEQPASAALECLIDELGLASYHVFEEGGTTRAGSLARLTALVREWEGDGQHWGEILGELRALRDERGYKQEGMTLDAGRDDVVRLMNLHQVKGLQARVVFLADCYDYHSDGHDPSWHVARTGEEPYVAIPVQRSNGPYHMETIAEPAGWPGDQALEDQFVEAEKLRLVYVAATRAENLLVVTHCPERKDKGPWRRLAPALSDVPELSLEPVGPEPVVGETADGDEVPDIETVRLEREERLAQAARASYVVRRASDHTDGEEDLSLRSRGQGDGAAYGTLVHELLEELVTGRLGEEVEAVVMHRGLREGLSIEQCEKVLRVLDRFERSDLYRRVCAAEVAYAEVPFALTETPGGDGAAGTELWRGTIDLVFRDAEGWHVVDYKTDLASADDAHAGEYFEQVRRYARYWKQLVGEDAPVASQSIWSTITFDIIEVPSEIGAASLS